MNRGIKGVLPPLITPFDREGRLDFGMHERNLEKWNEDRLSGFVVLGSNSETAFLSEDEKLELIENTVRTVSRDRLVIAGTGLESTAETLHFTNKAAARGADAALVLPPYFYRSQMIEKVLIDHYVTLADRADMPILLYNAPKFTGLELPVSVIAELSHHPNIIGLKDSSGNVAQLIRLKRMVSSGFNLIAGTASIWLPALVCGIEAGIMALANCLPNECAGIQDAYTRGNLPQALEMYEKVFPLNDLVTETFGISGLKYATNLAGYEAGYVRKPLPELSDENKLVISRAFSISKIFKE
jgi:4-hydroxy-2-oxoglutarate aldolase